MTQFKKQSNSQAKEAAGLASWFKQWHRGHQVGRGAMGCIILKALLEKPMHGYEIIRELEERSHGFWRPSAGSVYPTLQNLEEQGLINGQDKEDKRVYAVTDKGKEELKKRKAAFEQAWDQMAQSQGKKHWFRELAPLIREFMQTIHQLSHQDPAKDTTQMYKQAQSIIKQAIADLKKLT